MALPKLLLYGQQTFGATELWRQDFLLATVNCVHACSEGMNNIFGRSDEDLLHQIWYHAWYRMIVASA